MGIQKKNVALFWPLKTTTAQLTCGNWISVFISTLFCINLYMMSIRSSFSGQGINSKTTGLKSKKFQLRHTYTHTHPPKHIHRNQIETSQWTHKHTNIPGEREQHVKQSEITVARVVIKLNNSQLKRMHDDSGFDDEGKKGEHFII